MLLLEAAASVQRRLDSMQECVQHLGDEIARQRQSVRDLDFRLCGTNDILIDLVRELESRRINARKRFEKRERELEKDKDGAFLFLSDDTTMNAVIEHRGVLARLSEKARNSLYLLARETGCKTLGEFRHTSDGALLRFPQLGRRYLNEIRLVLGKKK